MIQQQVFHLLLVVLTSAAVWSLGVGTTLAEDEDKLLVSSGAPDSSFPTLSPNDSQQSTPTLTLSSTPTLTLSSTPTLTLTLNPTSEDYEDYDDYEDEYELLGSEELEDGTLPAKVQHVVKPNNEGRKKKGSKKSRSKGKRRGTERKKQKDPCKTDYKDYCIHGKCKFLKDLNQPSCVCLPGYQNERCGIQTLHVVTEKRINSLSIVLVVAAIMLLIFIITTVVVVILRIRRKMRVEHDILNEEKQKLRTENGNAV
ncbi:proheparin-binding EGF-like growth factor [Scyliorhinus canicula]|uniref:proheparin-binding EGF-like growth factor n=1 Tax=Scyliorhinus canicula TaxID=7830 RepID=UPI0018F64B07|nr:proheparin-binding EGF-like growth factor [Scyliorhinus canicula]